MYEFPVKKFFWALSKDFEFAEMPELNDQHKAAVNLANQYFEGNPKKVLIKVKKEGEGNQISSLTLKRVAPKVTRPRTPVPARRVVMELPRQRLITLVISQRMRRSRSLPKT